MFNNILLSQQNLWLVIAVFYLADNIKQIGGNQLVFRETWNLRWRALVPSDSLVLLNKQITILNILLPYTLALPVDWLTAEPCDPSRIRRADRVLQVSRRRIFYFRCISLVCFFGFFVEGPLLTYWHGLTYGLVHVAPIYAAALAMLSVALVVNRRSWHLYPAQIIATVAEAAVCPAYLVNATHRMSWKHIRVDADGGAYGLRRCRAQFRDDLKAALNFALEELEQNTANNPDERQRLFAYRESVLR